MIPLTIYGDGRQVRDVLFIDDLVDCYLSAVDQIQHTSGNVYNIGGGPQNQLSLLELLRILKTRFGRSTEVNYTDWRPGDQLVFVADLAKARKDFNWYPRVGVYDGLDRLYEWICREQDLLRAVLCH